MKLWLLALCVVFAIFATTAFAGNPDPRKCTEVGRNNQQPINWGCAHQKATLALGFYLQKQLRPGVSGFWQGSYSCDKADAKLLNWTCWFDSRLPQTTATVHFWATSNGWHTKVTIIG